MDEFFSRKGNWVLGSLALAVAVLTGILLVQFGVVSLPEPFEMAGVVLVTVVGFLLIIGIVLIVGVLCAFAVARIASLLFS